MREEIDGHICLAEIDCKYVLLFDPHQVVDAIDFDVLPRLLYPLRIDVETDRAAAEFLRRCDCDTAIAAAKVVEQLAPLDGGQFEVFPATIIGVVQRNDIEDGR